MKQEKLNNLKQKIMSLYNNINDSYDVNGLYIEDLEDQFLDNEDQFIDLINENLKSISNDLNNLKESYKDYKGYNNETYSINEILNFLKEYDNKESFDWLKNQIRKEKIYYEKKVKYPHLHCIRDQEIIKNHDKTLMQYDVIIECIKEERKKFIKSSK